MHSSTRVNSSDISDTDGEANDNIYDDSGSLITGSKTTGGNMMKPNRKRAVNLLVRTVGAPIQKSYIVSWID